LFTQARKSNQQELLNFYFSFQNSITSLADVKVR
jgi:hypothetical protein